ncbi:MAG: response regulator [Siphonobacter aquaeclarae]|nr:response regulator [Siphonobacter aquaeclarae]
MILLVDDRPENILPLKKILELHGFTVDTAESGEEALKKVLRANYSVMILDVQMPGMDGFEVAQALSGFSKARDTSIIFLSAVNKEKRFITKGYTSGGIDYLTKPVDPDILVLKVKILDKLYRQQQELLRIQASLENEIDVRKRAQDELAGRMDELRFVLESLPQMAFSIRQDGEIEFVNRQWFRYAEHASVFPETHPADAICDDWKSHFQAGKEFSAEVRLRDRVSGEYRYHLLRIIPVVREDESVGHWVGTYTDIHAQKLASETLEEEVALRTRELLAKNEELERTNHELQQFAWVVSHDLKEPLRKIQILNHAIREKFLKDDDEAASYLDRSIASSARMSLLINDLLEYSRLSAPDAFEWTDLDELVRGLLRDYDELLLSKGARVEVAPLPPMQVIPGRMRQVFQNLISNALKFSEEAPVIRIAAERIAEKAIHAEPDDEGEFCRITVSDNGIGFDEKFLGRIFIIFQRLHERSRYEGTGIGLAIAKKNIDRHNGLISARSTPGDGATFILVLPIRQPD